MRLASLLPLALLLVLAACADDPDATYQDRVAAEHAGDTPAASALGTDPGADVTTAHPVYARFGGDDVTGYLARPAAAPRDTTGLEAEMPGLIVIHEWWGLNDNIRHMTERLAAQGYVALAVDLYEGEVAETPDAASSLMSAATQNPDRLEQHLRAAYEYLEAQEQVDDIGVIGWCFGGHWALRAALAMPDEIDAAVVYYGQLITDRAQLQRLDMPVLGIFGAEDSTIPQGDVEQFQQTLQDLGVDVQVEVYEGAGHAFANPSGERFVEEAAEDAWQKTTAFLAEHLRDDAD